MDRLERKVAELEAQANYRSRLVVEAGAVGPTGPGKVLVGSSRMVLPGRGVAPVANMSLKQAMGYGVGSDVDATLLSVQEAITPTVTVDGRLLSTHVAIHLQGAEVPSDFSDYADYVEAYQCVPIIGNAVNLFQDFIWAGQGGIDLEGDKDEVKAAKKTLKKTRLGIHVPRGTLTALMLGNAYWRRAPDNKLVALNPMGVGRKRPKDKDNPEEAPWVYRASAQDPPTEIEAKEMIHLSFDALQWETWGNGVIRRLLFTEKNIAYMQQHLPIIARNRADPWLWFVLQNAMTPGLPPATPEEFNRIKESIKSRREGENIFDDNSIGKIEEVYKESGPRQALENIYNLYRDDLIGGTGAPEVLLGFGSTTLKGTATEQMRGFEARVRSKQEQITLFLTDVIWPAFKIPETVMPHWPEVTPEDKAQLTSRILAQRGAGLITIAYANAMLGNTPLTDQPVDKFDSGSPAEDR